MRLRFASRLSEERQLEQSRLGRSGPSASGLALAAQRVGGQVQRAPAHAGVGTQRVTQRSGPRVAKLVAVQMQMPSRCR